MILSKIVTINLHPSNIKLYESLGYNIPKSINYNRLVVKRGSTLEVKVIDLPNKSHTRVLCRCDNPNCNNGHPVENWIEYRETKNTTKYLCLQCECKTFEHKEKLKKSQIGKHLGNKNSNYNHKLTTKERYNDKHRSIYPGYLQWRRSVLKRDNYTCQFPGCNNKDNICTHHINNWSDFKEQRTNINNGVTLCEKHHKLFHKQYGLMHTNKNQYDQFTFQLI